MNTTIAESHPELFHYTGLQGLTGILTSQTLRATHALNLNDKTEAIKFRDLLPEILRPAVSRGLRASSSQGLMETHGGIEAAIDEVATAIPTAIFQALLGTVHSQPSIDPFIISFSAPATPDIANHGLLSQWRGYSQDGYALVFDTDLLSALLDQQAKTWSGDLFGGDVVYSSASTDELDQEFGIFFADLRNAIEQWLTNPANVELLEPTYPAIIQCACRYKDWSFFEEKEVRIIAIPTNREIIQYQAMRGIHIPEITRKEFRRGNGTKAAYIDLFDGSERRLPVSRIIVGPYGDRTDRKRHVDSLLQQLGLDIPVTISDIPLV